MIAPDRDPVRELIEQVRELRRSEQPPAELFAAALARLDQEERAREECRQEKRAGTGARRWLFRLTSPRLGVALVLALAGIASWRALRPTAMVGQHVEPAVALAPEPEQRPQSPADTSTAPTGTAGAGDRSGSAPRAENAPPPVLEIESPPDQADAGAQPASAVAAAAEKNAKRAERDAVEHALAEAIRGATAAARWDVVAQLARELEARRLERQAPDKAGNPTSADKTAGMKEDGKKKPAPEGSTKRPADKPARPPPPDCKPPWFIDTLGIRRLKPECL